MDGWDGFKGPPQRSLVGTVMAALSEGARRSMHPADLRQRAEAALRVAMAVETAFLLSERRHPDGPDGAAQAALLSQTYE